MHVMTSKKLIHILIIGIFCMVIEGIDSPSWGKDIPKCADLMDRCKRGGSLANCTVYPDVPRVLCDKLRYKEGEDVTYKACIRGCTFTAGHNLPNGQKQCKGSCE